MSRKTKATPWNVDRTSEICNSNLLRWILSWRLSIPKPWKVLWMPKPSKAQMQHFQPLSESWKLNRLDFSPAGSNVGSREGGLCHQFVEMMFFFGVSCEDFHIHIWSCTDIYACPKSTRSLGLLQLFGAGADWCKSHYCALPSQRYIFREGHGGVLD